MLAKLTSNRCDINCILLTLKIIKTIWDILNLSERAEENNLAANLCTHINQAANRHIVCYHASDPHALKIAHQTKQRKCVWLCVCVWWIPGRNTVTFDHFNHFLLYLCQLLGWALIAALLCFDAPDSTKQRGKPTCCAPQLSISKGIVSRLMWDWDQIIN